MRMTKQEVKEEYKQQEGDPQIKGRIRQRMREASQRRMMQNLPPGRCGYYEPHALCGCHKI